MTRILPLLVFTLLIAAFAFWLVGQKKTSTAGQQTPPPEEIVKIENTNLAIGDDGTIRGSDKNLPQIFMPQNTAYSEGVKLDEPHILGALSIVKLLAKSDFLPTSIRFTSDTDLAVYNQQGQIALFSTQKQPQTQVDSLQQVLAKAKINATKIAKIDLRFNLPVVSTTNGQR